MKYVPSTVVIGENGPCITRGYMEISGVRFYDDQVVIGDRGQRVISPGWTEIVPAKSTDLTWPLRWR